jgi:hypothetical protein
MFRRWTVAGSQSLEKMYMDTKVYLRHARTRSYYSGWRCWTDDVQRAENFESAEHAMQRARDEQMNLMEVVIQGPEKETVIPVIKPVSL